MLYIILILCFFCFQSCGQDLKNDNQTKSQGIAKRPSEAVNDDQVINSAGNSILERIAPPKGFQRQSLAEESFGHYLRNLPLKPHGSKVLYYHGGEKANPDIYTAVVDLKIGNRNLHQCADAVMRLRAAYLWEQKRYNEIHFNFTNGFRVDYTEWMKGKRIVVKGNESFWRDAGRASNTYRDFWDYLEVIFSYAGTLSLSKELKPVKIDDLRVGDVFIQGGSPGHAVIVVDMAIDAQTNDKVFLLAQSYMPAQDIQVLTNPGNDKLSPWYSLEFGDKLITPEWTFHQTDLKRFEIP